MSELFLAFAAIILALALVLSAIQENRRITAIEEKFKDLENKPPGYVDPQARAITQLQNKLDEFWKALCNVEKIGNERYQKQHEFNAHTGREAERLTGEVNRLVKEYDVIHTRQRTLEKRIISAERIVTINVHGIDPKKIGKGRGALIRESKT